ncbi:MAG: 3-phosphoglycerate dehydrogenase [Planctomycetia bacterium]|nr:3-phosphoglycerate dehydrogenase [Planctomycetia bacterium]MCC7314560.1 3-phosphoglycerate dehydrogenase [Planctomycetota bacterium]
MRGRAPFRIVIAEPYAPQAVDRLRQIGEVVVLEDSSPQSLLSVIQDADALLVRSKAHVTARIIEAASKLKVIARASTNTDHIDLRAARRKSIAVVYAPHIAVTSTAQFALAMILSLRRRLPQLDRFIREGSFESLRAPAGREMGHEVLGLLGMDPVAEHLARMCQAAFGTRAIYFDPQGRTPTLPSVDAVSLDELLTTSDILSVHLAPHAETRHFLDAGRMARLKSSAILINTTRGNAIDTIELARALKRGLLAGAGLDVFEIEPLAANHPLRRAPNCLLTPHVAGATLDAADDRYSVTDDVARILLGETPHHAVSVADPDVVPS